MLTGDLITDLPYMSLSPSMIFPYAEEQVIDHFSKILHNNYTDPSLITLRRLLMQSLDWNFIISKYREFKLENGDMNSFAKFVSGTLNTFSGSSRKKRQVDIFQSNEILNLTQIESVMTDLQSLNISMMGDVIVTLTSEMSVIIGEMQTMSELLAASEAENLVTMISMMMTSPQLAKITQRIFIMMEKLQPFMKDSEYFPMFSNVKESFSTLNQFFQNSTLMLSSLVNNWPDIEKFALQEEIFSQAELNKMSDTLISPHIIFSLFKKLEEFECSEEGVTRYLEFYGNQALLNTSLKSMVEATCGFVISENLIELIFVMDMDSAIDYLISMFGLSPSNLATASNLTPEQLESAMDSLNDGLSIFPDVMDILTLLKDDLNVTEFNVSTVSMLFCGEEMQEITTNYKVSR